MLAQEPVAVSELARRLEVDKAGVSRVLASLHREGWVERTGRRYVLGPRALALGGPGDGTVIARASDVVRRVGDGTGLTAVAVRIAGTGAQPLALHEDGLAGDFREGAAAFEHLVCTAAGVALLAQLEPRAVRAHLALDPWPELQGDGPRSATEAAALVARVGRGAPAVEHGWTVPGVACVAVPWPSLGPTPAALALIGPAGDVVGRTDDLARVLREAVGGDR